MYKFFSSSLFLLFLVGISIKADEISLKTELINRQQEHSILIDYNTLEKNLNLEFSDIIRKILKANPSAAQYIFKNKKLILKQITSALHLGVQYNSKPNSNSVPLDLKPINSSDYFSPVIIKSNKIIYIRMDNFISDSIKKLYNDLIAIMRYSQKPVGIVLDLRNCIANDQKTAVQALNIFCKPENIMKNKEFSTLDTFKKFISLPSIVIIGKKTRGTPEVFAVLLKQLSQTILYGEQTFGSPFPFSIVELNSGAELKIPIIPEVFKSIPPYPVKPDIEFHNTYPQISYKDFTTKKEYENKDQAINRASEILLCLVALTKTNKNK
jgi:C-terminal processing protease CtpA/Prc